jgi:glutathione S-transferase
MAMTFYWMSGSPYAWRAMLALEFKGMKYESRRLDPSQGEHKTAQFLALNPRGKVPVLQDGDFAVYESLAILEYLECTQPEPALFGSDPRETAAIWQRICELDNYVGPAVMDFVRPILFDASDPEPSAISDAASDVHRELEPLEKLLAGSSYLNGDRLTGADIAFLPIVNYLIRASEKLPAEAKEFGFLPLDHRYGNIAAWLTRMQSMAGYDNAYPPHWRE